MSSSTSSFSSSSDSEETNSRRRSGCSSASESTDNLVDKAAVEALFGDEPAAPIDTLTVPKAPWSRVYKSMRARFTRRRPRRAVRFRGDEGISREMPDLYDSNYVNYQGYWLLAKGEALEPNQCAEVPLGSMAFHFETDGVAAEVTDSKIAAAVLQRVSKTGEVPNEVVVMGHSLRVDWIPPTTEFLFHGDPTKAGFLSQDNFGGRFRVTPLKEVTEIESRPLNDNAWVDLHSFRTWAKPMPPGSKYA